MLTAHWVGPVEKKRCDAGGVPIVRRNFAESDCTCATFDYL
jgi:hypothetical protein